MIVKVICIHSYHERLGPPLLSFVPTKRILLSIIFDQSRRFHFHKMSVGGQVNFVDKFCDVIISRQLEPVHFSAVNDGRVAEPGAEHAAELLVLVDADVLRFVGIRLHLKNKITKALGNMYRHYDSSSQT